MVVAAAPVVAAVDVSAVRRFRRALCSCDFELPEVQPIMRAIS